MSVNIYNAETDSLQKVATNLYSDDKVAEVGNKVDASLNQIYDLSTLSFDEALAHICNEIYTDYIGTINCLMRCKGYGGAGTAVANYIIQGFKAENGVTSGYIKQLALNNSFQFWVTKDGADTVTPFKKGFTDSITINDGTQTVSFTAIIGHRYLVSSAGNTPSNATDLGGVSGATIIKKSNIVKTAGVSNRIAILQTALIEATSTTVEFSARSDPSSSKDSSCLTYIDVTDL